MVDRYYNHVSHTLLVTTTRAVRKFVHEHDGIQVPLLDKILASLEADDFKAASKLFGTIHFGAYEAADLRRIGRGLHGFSALDRGGGMLLLRSGVARAPPRSTATTLSRL